MANRVITRSWGSRLGDSIKGVFGGIVLFGLSFVLLWWNEGEAVRRYKQLNEILIEGITVSAEAVVTANENALVHMSGMATTPDELRDPVFGLPVSAIRFRRSVEMFQWREEEVKETRDKIGGGPDIILSYRHRMEWSSTLIDSRRFEDPSPDRVNPPDMRYQGVEFIADTVNLGSFQLHPDMVRSSMNFWEPLNPRQPDLPEGARVEGRQIFFGRDPANPQVGDLRVTFEIVPDTEITVVARQSENRLVPWRDSKNQSIYLLRRGDHDLNDMVQMSRQDVRIQTWIFRGLGWLLMTIGINLVLRPIVMFGMVLPFLGRLIGGGLGLAAALLSAVLTLITIGVAWVAVRPMVGIPLLIAAGVLLGMQFTRSRKPKPAPAQA